MSMPSATVENSLDNIFFALSDRTRRSLLGSLAGKASTITDLAKPFQMSFPAVSKHLKVLERAGLVSRAVDGRVHRCSLSPEPLRAVEEYLAQYRSFWVGTLDSLAKYFDQNPKEVEKDE